MATIGFHASQAWSTPGGLAAVQGRGSRAGMKKSKGKGQKLGLLEKGTRETFVLRFCPLFLPFAF